MEQNRCPGCMEIKNGAVCPHCGYEEQKQNEPHQLQTGTVLQDKYLVGRALGQGGFGITYLGWNRFLEKKVAIKEYYPSFFVERHTGFSTKVTCKTERMEEAFGENRLRFLREAKLLAKLESVPQIVSILDFFEANNTAYIVMEYLQGNDLKSYIRKRGGSLTPAETFSILRPVMAALVKVHEAGLVHRDISPDNIMLQFDGSVKLMDFGAARSVNNPGVEKELTQATQAIVKHGFAPMEQYSEKGSIGPWTDEYALCATMYYCMTGKVPENVHDRIMAEEDLDWDGIAGLTERQKQILRKGMAIWPKDRYRTIRELMDAMFPQQAKKAEEPSRRKPSVKEKKKNPKARKRMAVLLIGAILLVVLVFAVLPKGWVEQNGDYYYYRMGAKVTGWQEIDGSRYHFDGDGKMETGWQRIDGSTYYFESNGEAATNWQTINDHQYYFGTDGEMVTGWQTIGNAKYYFRQSGVMESGWRLIDGKKYYFDADGEMVTGWKWIGSARYYFRQGGVMESGWRLIDGEKYYFSTNGVMQIGWQAIDGFTYHFDSDGKMETGWQTINNERFYFGNDGRMAIGWREIDGHKYYFKETLGKGHMVTGVRIIEGKQYTFGEDGRLIE